MGVEYKIETNDLSRTNLPEFLRKRTDFQREEDGVLYLGTSPEQILFSVKKELKHVYLCQYVASTETDALLGLLIRRILASNDHIVISEL